MSSVFSLDDDPIVLVVPSSASIPPGNITAAEWLAIKDRVLVVEGRRLGDLADVDTSSVADGDAIVYDAGADAWVPGIASVPIPGRHDTNEIIGDIKEIATSTERGTTSVESEFVSGRYIVGVNFGGTGTSTAVARSDHAHFQPIPERVSTVPSGYISGGSQPLGSTSITVSAGKTYAIEAELYGQFRGADSGAAYYTLSITIDGISRTSPGGTDGFWCVQGVPDKIYWEHARRLTGTGTAITVSASVAWHSGSGFNIDRTYLKVRVRPDN